MRNAVFLTILLGFLILLGGRAEEQVSALSSEAKAELEATPVYICPRCPNPVIIPEKLFNDPNRPNRVLILVPKDTSPLDVRVRMNMSDAAHDYKDISVRLPNAEDHELWWQQIHTIATGRTDFFMTLRMGKNFESQAQGSYQKAAVFNWSQNDEYRVLALAKSENPNAPEFSMILSDEILLGAVQDPASPGALIPSFSPSLSVKPWNPGIAMEGGRRVRYKVSVGGGLGLDAIPNVRSEISPRVFFRLQLHFR